MVLDLDISIDVSLPADRLHSALSDLIDRVQPSWKGQAKEFKRLEKGWHNSLWLCCGLGQELVIKVHRDLRMTVHPRGVSHNQFTIMKKLTEEELIQPLLCRFTNGLVYRYARGEVLSFDDLRDKRLRRIALESLHAIHRVRGATEFYGREERRLQDSFYYNAKTCLQLRPSRIYADPRFKDWNLPTPEELEEEVSWSLQFYDALFDKYPLVLCHQDFFHDNMVFDKEKERIWLIDWEVSGYSIAPIELVMATQDWHEYTNSDGLMRDWIIDYLETHPDKPMVTDEVVDEWLDDCTIAVMLVTVGLLKWLYRVLVQPSYSHKREDNIGILRGIHTVYLESKAKVVKLMSKQ